MSVVLFVFVLRLKHVESQQNNIRATSWNLCYFSDFQLQITDWGNIQVVKIIHLMYSSHVNKAVIVSFKEILKVQMRHQPKKTNS